MKVFKYEKNVQVRKSYLYEALELDLNKSYVISFVGGGGKTSSIYELANELVALNKKVIITTTTHMKMNKGNTVLSDNISEIKSMLRENNFITVGIKSKDDKITSISEERVKEMAKICDFLLIEADGAKMLPLKAPAEYEPVILDISNMVVGVCGIDALDKKICDICHRPHIVSRMLNKELEEVIQVKDIAYLLSSEEGQMKDVRDYMEYRVIINKADDEASLENAWLIVKDLENKNIQAIVTSYYK